MRIAIRFAFQRKAALVNAKIYTLAEARAALPQVKTLMEQAQRARTALLQARPDLWPVLKKAATNGGSKEASHALEHYRALEAGIKGIQALGVVVKDVDQGLVDFIGTRDGREIYLCWKYGEDEIAHWHDLNAGFAGRRPLDDAVA
ncbi:MAG: DUF2203 domain-containing protein [Caldilineaceae bacterium]